STDNTIEAIQDYINKDNRFILLQRAETKPKGANACRNIGLENAQGEYIVFFDSDDLMTPDHLEVKINAITESGCDYVITRTEYFNLKTDRMVTYYQEYDTYKITPYNYIAQLINWVT